MTTSEQNQLEGLWADYLEKKKNYEIELTANYLASNGHEEFPGHKKMSDASLIVKRELMASALNSYDKLNANIIANNKLKFIADNPQIAVETTKTDAKERLDLVAQADKKALEAEKATFAQKNTKLILYAGIVLVVVVVGVVVYFKFFIKARP